MEASALTHASRRGLLARRSPVLKLERDEQLVALIRSGHDRAFEVLFDRYHGRLLAFCSSMLRSRQDAEDVLQEVFANAHAAMLADDRKINVRPWLYRIARNRCLNYLRKPVPEGQDSMDILPHLNGSTTAERVQDREELRQVLSDVGTLPETQRTALLLREIDQLSYEDIAVAMDTTIPAVKSLLVRARITLAESSEARTLSCDEVRVALAEAAEGISRATGPVRLHVRDCESCGAFRKQLRSDSKALAAIMPAGPLALLSGVLAKVFGGGGAAGGAAGGGAGASTSGAIGAIGGSAAASGTATAGGLGAIGGAIGTKAAAGVATAALLTAGAVEVRQVTGETAATPPASVRPATAPPSAHPEGRSQRVGEAERKELAGAAAAPAVRPERTAPAGDRPAEEPAPPATGASESAAAGEPAAEPAPAEEAPPQEAVIAEPEAPAAEGGTGRESNTGGTDGGVEPPAPTKPAQPSVPVPPADGSGEPVGTQPAGTEGTATAPPPQPPTGQTAASR